MDAELSERIEGYRLGKRAPSRAEGFRRLVKKGLAK
jgi:hypothetical protein